MNAQQLQLPDGAKLKAFRCAKCGRIWPNAQDLAERCCVCQDCGVEHKDNDSRCSKCRSAHYAKVEQDRLDRAVVLTGYTGPVVIGDRYWATLGDFLDERDGEEIPEFVHTCHIEPRVSIDIDNVIESRLEDNSIEDDDFGPDDLEGIDELREAVKKFNDANAKKVVWWEDPKHKVATAANYSPSEPSV